MSDGTRPVEPLIEECERQAENCNYTAASLYIWQKQARIWRGVFLVIPIVLSGFATSQLLIEFLGPKGQFFAVAAGVLAGFFPAIYISLNMDMRVVEIARSASEFTNLRDRFRQAGMIKSSLPLDEFETAFEALMDRMDAGRASSPPVPEWCFRKAQKKVGRGDYEYDADIHRKSWKPPGT